MWTIRLLRIGAKSVYLSDQVLSMSSNFDRNLRETLWLGGSFTRLCDINGKSMSEMERILGFHSGRFQNGILIYAAAGHKPKTLNFFEFAGSPALNTSDALLSLSLINKDKRSKRKILSKHIETSGPNRLVKILPVMQQGLLPIIDRNFAYPPGSSDAMQFKINVDHPILCKLLAHLTLYPGERLQAK